MVFGIAYNDHLFAGETYSKFFRYCIFVDIELIYVVNVGSPLIIDDKFNLTVSIFHVLVIVVCFSSSETHGQYHIILLKLGQHFDFSRFHEFL